MGLFSGVVKQFFLNSKNTKPTRSKQYFVICCALMLMISVFLKDAADLKTQGDYNSVYQRTSYQTYCSKAFLLLLENFMIYE